MTSDEYPAYEAVIETAFSQPVVAGASPARVALRCCPSGASTLV
jgi:hypothetical protein